MRRDDGVEVAKADAWSDEEAPNHADTMLVLIKEMREILTLMVIKRWATRWVTRGQCIKKGLEQSVALNKNKEEKEVCCSYVMMMIR